MKRWSPKDLFHFWKKKYIFLFTPSKLGKTPIFRGFSLIFQICVTFFWLMLHVIPVCHFEALTIVKKKYSGKQIFFSRTTQNCKSDITPSVHDAPLCHTIPYQSKPYQTILNCTKPYNISSLYLHLRSTAISIHNATLLSCHFQRIATVSHFQLVFIGFYYTYEMVLVHINLSLQL